ALPRRLACPGAGRLRVRDAARRGTPADHRVVQGRRSGDRRLVRLAGPRQKPPRSRGITQFRPSRARFRRATSLPDVMLPGRRTLALLATVVCVGAGGVGQAQAANLVLPNWPQLLPANPFTPSGTVPLGWDVCKSGKPSCPGKVIDEM